MKPIKVVYNDVMKLVERLSKLSNYEAVMLDVEDYSPPHTELGSISLREFFENHDIYHPKFLSENEVVSWIENNKPYYFESGDTFKNSGRLERNIDYTVIRGRQGALVAINIHVGIDPRFGFSDTFCMLFESADDWFDFLGLYQFIGNVAYRFDNQVWYISLRGNVIDNEISGFDFRTGKNFKYEHELTDDEVIEFLKEFNSDYEFLGLEN